MATCNYSQETTKSFGSPTQVNNKINKIINTTSSKINNTINSINNKINTSSNQLTLNRVANTLSNACILERLSMLKEEKQNQELKLSNGKDMDKSINNLYWSKLIAIISTLFLAIQERFCHQKIDREKIK